MMPADEGVAGAEHEREAPPPVQKPQTQVSNTHSTSTLTVSRSRQKPASSIVKPACMPNTRNAPSRTQPVLSGLIRPPPFVVLYRIWSGLRGGRRRGRLGRRRCRLLRVNRGARRRPDQRRADRDHPEQGGDPQCLARKQHHPVASPLWVAQPRRQPRELLRVVHLSWRRRRTKSCARRAAFEQEHGPPQTHKGHKERKKPDTMRRIRSHKSPP